MIFLGRSFLNNGKILFPLFHTHTQHTLKEEHIVDESEIIEEDGELITTDDRFGVNGNDLNEPTTNLDKQFRLERQQRHQNLSTIDHAMHDDDDDDDNGGSIVTYIETEVDAEVDPLNLEQICVPVDGDNVSWIGLSS